MSTFPGKPPKPPRQSNIGQAPPSPPPPPLYSGSSASTSSSRRSGSAQRRKQSSSASSKGGSSVFDSAFDMTWFDNDDPHLNNASNIVKSPRSLFVDKDSNIAVEEEDGGGDRFAPLDLRKANHRYPGVSKLLRQTKKRLETPDGVMRTSSARSHKSPTKHLDSTAAEYGDVDEAVIHVVPFYLERKNIFYCCTVVAAVIMGIALGVSLSSADRKNAASSAIRKPPAFPPGSSTASPTPYILNDACETARGPVIVNYNTILGTIDDASPQEAPPVCVNDNSAAFSSSGTTVGKWYKVMGGDQVLLASTVSGYTSFDSVISVYAGSDCGRLKCVAGNDNYNQFKTQSTITWFAQKGQMYYVHVYAATSSGTGDYELTIGYEQNGFCTEAVGPLIPDKSLVHIGSMSASTTGSVASSNIPCASQIAGDVDKIVWYSVKGTGSWMVASTCHSMTDIDARLFVMGSTCYNGNCTTSIRDSSCGSNGHRVIFETEADVYYYIMVYTTKTTSDFNTGTQFGLTVEEFTPVENDVCENAIPLAASTTSVIPGSTLKATFQEGVYRACFSGTVRAQPGVWYSVSGSGNRMFATTCNDMTQFDTQLLVFTGSCGALDCVATQTQSCGGKGAVHWDSSIGTTYYILVYGSNVATGANVGTFGLTTGDFQPVFNDVCKDAKQISPGYHDEGSTFWSTPEMVPVCGSDSIKSPGVWYWTTGNGQPMRASTCSASTKFESVLSVYSGYCGDTMECESSAERHVCGSQGAITWKAEADKTYFIYVHGQSSSAIGEFSLQLDTYQNPVANDYCADAISITTDGSVLTGSTLYATFDSAGTCGYVSNTAPGVWYHMTGTGKPLAVNLCHSSTDYDTAVSVFTGSCTSLDCVASNNDGYRISCGSSSLAEFESVKGQDYYILVHGHEATATGNYGISVSEVSPVVQNDYCAFAQQVSIGSTAISASTFNAMIDSVPSCYDVEATGPGIWYKVTGNGERLFASTCDEKGLESSTMDTKISVFEGGCGNLTCVMGDDDACGNKSRAIWQSEYGTEYYILVHGSKAGSFHLIVDQFYAVQNNDFCPDKSSGIYLVPNGIAITGSTVGASSDDMGRCGPTISGPGVWYLVNGTDTTLTVDTCDDRTGFDTMLSIFQGDSCDTLACVGGNDDACSLHSAYTWIAAKGTTYWVLLHSANSANTGIFALRLSQANQ